MFFISYDVPELDPKIVEVHDIAARHILSYIEILVLLVVIVLSVLKLTRFRAAYIIFLSLSIIHYVIADSHTTKLVKLENRNNSLSKESLRITSNDSEFYIRIFTPYFHWSATFLLTSVYVFFVDTKKPQMFQLSTKGSLGVCLSTIPICFLLTGILIWLSSVDSVAIMFAQIVATFILMFLVKRSSSKWSKRFHNYQITEYKKSKNRIDTTLNVYLCAQMAVCLLFLTPIKEAAFSYWIAYEFAQWFIPFLQTVMLCIYVHYYANDRLPPLLKPLKAEGDEGVPITDLREILGCQAPDRNPAQIAIFLQLREEMSRPQSHGVPHIKAPTK